MNEMMIYGLSALLICFTVLTFLLARLQTDVFPEDYEFSLDPFWYVIAVMFIGASGVYFLFPKMPDTIRTYNYLTVFWPFLFAVLIYGGYLLDIAWLANLLTIGAAFIISFMQDADFLLFDELSCFQNRVIVACLIFILSKGLSLLNGISGIASMQFCTVMITAVVLAHFGALPQFLAVLAMAYLGTMLAFAFFSWPPEKIVMSHGAFASFGFIMGCFMLNASAEFADAPMLIASSYLFTEFAVVLYNRFICREEVPEFFMDTAYYRVSQKGVYEVGVVRAVLKILIIDVVLSMIQIAASERFALPFFTFALNLWFLSILSGNSQPDEFFSLTKLGTRAFRKLFHKKEKK